MAALLGGHWSRPIPFSRLARKKFSLGDKHELLENGLYVDDFACCWLCVVAFVISIRLEVGV